MLLPTLSNLKVILMGSRPWIRVVWLQWSRALWRKKDGADTLSRGELADPCLERLLLLFWAHYMENGPHSLCTGCFRWLPFTDNKGEEVANYYKEKGYLQMQREKWLNWFHSSLECLA